MRRRLLDHTYKKTVTGNPAVAKSVARMYPDISFSGFTIQDGEPSPENPVDIVNAGKYNVENGKYEIEVKMYGKNMFDKNTILPKNSYDIQEGSYQRKYFYLPHNMKCTLYINLKLEENPTNVDAFMATGTEDYDNASANGISALFSNTGIKKIKFITPSDGKMILKINNNASDENVLYCIQNSDIMVCPQTDNPIFFEYQQPQTVTITSDRPITKWDKLTKKGNVWGWEYQTTYIESYNGEEITGEWQSTTGELSTGASVQYKTPPEFDPLSDEEQQLMNALHTNNPTTIVQNSIGTDVTLTYKTKRSLEVTQ